MPARYVLADLVRNPRRTLSTAVGVTLGVGLFCGVLFIVDGLSASMPQRAVAPLAIDIQRIVTQPNGATLTMSQTVEPTGPQSAGDEATVVLDITNGGEVDVNEVIVRSRPADEVAFVPASAVIDGIPVTSVGLNPFSHGSGQAGYNLDTLAPGSTHRLEYRVTAVTAVDLDAALVESTYSSRENPAPVPAGQPSTVDLRDLAQNLSALEGVAAATPLSIATLDWTRSHTVAPRPAFPSRSSASTMTTLPTTPASTSSMARWPSTARWSAPRSLPHWTLRSATPSP